MCVHVVSPRTELEYPFIILSIQTHRLHGVEMTSQPLAGQDLTLLVIQSFVRGRHWPLQQERAILGAAGLSDFCSYSLASFVVRCIRNTLEGTNVHVRNRNIKMFKHT